jgi:hypothetical protein
MRTKLLAFIGLILLLCGMPAHAQVGTPKTQIQLNTEINQLFPDQNSGLITPFNLRQTLLDIVASNPPTGQPIANVLNFGVAACTGSTDASAAVAAAITAGFFRIYIPSGCFYQPPTGGGSETVPNGITIIGQNADPNVGNVCLVRTANRASSSDLLQLGARSSIIGCAIQSNFCDVQTVPLSTAKVCPLIGTAYNSGDQAEPLQNWPYEQNFYTTGTTTTQPGVPAANDSPIVAYIMNNTGDAIFVATNAGGVGVRAQTGGSGGDNGFLATNAAGGGPANAHLGFHCTEAGTNASGACFEAERLNGGTSPMFILKDDGPGTATTDWEQLIVSFQTAGNIFDIFQTTTAFSGNFFNINAGNSGGTCTGNFILFTIANVNRSTISCNGNQTNSGTLTLGANGGTGGSLTLNGATSGSVLLTTPATGGGVISNGDIYSNDATFLIRTQTTLTNGAGGTTAVINNAPSATPTKWISIDDNGTTRRIPAW